MFIAIHIICIADIHERELMMAHTHTNASSAYFTSHWCWVLSECVVVCDDPALGNAMQYVNCALAFLGERRWGGMVISSCT